MARSREPFDPKQVVLPAGYSDWHVVRRLGEGGQAQVVEIRNAATGERRAFKRLHRPTAKGIKRAQREFDAMSKIDHPNVVRLLDRGEDEHGPWCMLPIGEMLEQFWDAQGHETPAHQFERARDIILGVVDGLCAVHDAGLVHRDVKEQNVIIIDGKAKLIDFGIVYDAAYRDDRVTETAERTININAPASAGAYGRVDVPKPWIDCAGVACVWAWLVAVGREPKAGKYHWKHHAMIDDARCERVRTILAVCMLESAAPENAHALKALIDRLGLGAAAPLAATIDVLDEGFAKLKATDQEVEAKRLLAETERREIAEAFAGLLTTIYEPIIDRMRAAFTKAQQAGLPLHGQFTTKAVSEIFASVCQPNLREQFFEYRLGDRGARMAFMVQAWHPLLKGFMPFSFHLILSVGPVAVKERPPEMAPVFLHDGSGVRVVVRDEREPKPEGTMGDAELTALVTGWLLDERVWNAVRRPLPELPR